MDYTRIFCLANDFAKEPGSRSNLPVLASGAGQRRRAGEMPLGELPAIFIAFHTWSPSATSRGITRTWGSITPPNFPGSLSYNRFVQVMPTFVFPLRVFLCSCCGACSGVSFIDSTVLAVCKRKRLSRHKVFRDSAKLGKSSTGWFFGFKLRLVINDRGEIIAFRITPGNRRPVAVLLRGAWGWALGDKGCISSALFEKLRGSGIRLVTTLKSNMKDKGRDMGERIMLRKRSIIETVNDQLKNISQIERTRHRSPVNFPANMFAALLAYCFKPNKPSLCRDPFARNLVLA